jgi:uracil-DNA glycosylase family protein
MCSVVKKAAAKSIRDISRLKRRRSQSDTSGAASLISPHTSSPHTSLADLRRAASGCKACDLWKTGTQTVFGEGKSSAAVMMVGEQPGDQEDRTGRPFVGPAGRILDQALAEAGIDRAEVYVTNVVKHFKWSPAERGKRRIHKKPRYSEIQACRPWLDSELDAVRPKVLVCLGASAAQALLGKDFRVTRDRGRLIPSDLAANVIATVHPSSILRAQDDESRRLQLEAFIKDLKQVARVMRGARLRTTEGRNKARQ